MIARLVLALLALAAAAPASARIGESFSTLRTRYGKPQPQVQKNSAVWFFDNDDEKQMLLAVTFNNDNVSIAEGLRSVRKIPLKEEDVRAFIEMQLDPRSPKVRSIKPGEKYTFAGKDFVRAAEEEVLIDDAAGIMVVWNKSKQDPSVLAVSREMLK